MSLNQQTDTVSIIAQFLPIYNQVHDIGLVCRSWYKVVHYNPYFLKSVLIDRFLLDQIIGIDWAFDNFKAIRKFIGETESNDCEEIDWVRVFQHLFYLLPRNITDDSMVLNFNVM